MDKIFYAKAKVHPFSFEFIYAASLWGMVQQSSEIVKFVMSTDGL